MVCAVVGWQYGIGYFLFLISEVNALCCIVRAYTHIYICICLPVCYVYMCNIYMYACMCIRTYVHMYVHMYACMHVCTILSLENFVWNGRCKIFRGFP